MICPVESRKGARISTTCRGRARKGGSEGGWEGRRKEWRRGGGSELRRKGEEARREGGKAGRREEGREGEKGSVSELVCALMGVGVLLQRIVTIAFHLFRCKEGWTDGQKVGSDRLIGIIP